MNFFYGAIAIIASLLISKRCESASASVVRIFALSFVLEFILILAIGAVFYSLKLGFFADAELNNPLLRIIGFAAFLAFLVGVKTVNRSRVLREEREQDKRIELEGG